MLGWAPTAQATVEGPESSAAAAVGVSALKLSLPECLQRAFRFHPLLAAKLSEVQAAEEQSAAVAGRRWPTLQGHAFSGVVPAAHGDAVRTTTPADDYVEQIRQLGPFFRFDIAVVQPLWTFGKLAHASQAAQRLVEVKKAEKLAVAWEVSTQVKTLYHGWLFMEETLALIEEIKAKIATSREVLEKRLAAEDGSVRPTDRLRLQSFEGEVLRREVEARRRLNDLRDALTRVVGLPAAEAWHPSDTKLSAVAVQRLEVEQLEALALEAQPQLRRVRAARLAATAHKEYRQSLLYPDLFVGGELSYATAPGRDRQLSPFAREDFNYLRFGAAVGLRYQWETGVLHHAWREAQAAQQVYQENERALLLKVQHDVRAAFGQYQAETEKLRLGQSTFRVTRAWSASAVNGFEMGTITLKEVIDALTEHIKARFSLLEAIFNFNEAVSAVSGAVGQELQEGLQNGTSLAP